MIIDTTTEVILNWGVSHFLKPKPPPIARNSFESLTTVKNEFITTFKVVETRQHNFEYQFKINEEMPRFSFVPVGREIFHRLCLRIAVAKGLIEFVTPTEKAGDEKRQRDEQIKMAMDMAYASRSALSRPLNSHDVNEDDLYGSEEEDQIITAKNKLSST